MNRLMMMAGVLFTLSACHWSCGTVSQGRLTVTPEVACAGRTVTVSWSASGSSVVVRAPGGAVLSTARSGTATFVASTSGPVELTVDGISSNHPFEVQSGRTERVLIAPTSCGLLAYYGLYGITGNWGPMQTYDPSIRVTGLRAPGRPMDFVHDGMRYTVGADGMLPLAGTMAFDGWWTFESLLLPSETCSPFPSGGARTAPTALTGVVYTECR